MNREDTERSGAGAMRGGGSGDGPERVVVVGGGYAGLFAVRRASRGSRRGRVEVTFVDPAPEWVERTRLHQVAAGDASVKRWPLAKLFRGTGVRVVGGRVAGIDPEDGGWTWRPGTVPPRVFRSTGSCTPWGARPTRGPCRERASTPSSWTAPRRLRTCGVP